ncbi:hypothetical protein F4824DRAFT_476137 [Ustulina deusta]|nr:hypothetical protein F4824DRAFT_476137 [Ustulina deusta]
MRYSVVFAATLCAFLVSAAPVDPVKRHEVDNSYTNKINRRSDADTAYTKEVSDKRSDADTAYTKEVSDKRSDADTAYTKEVSD